MTPTTPPTPRRRPSMADVGRHADVSAQTVSRFYTGGYVSPEARSRIETAVGELGYRPNRLPRNLRATHTDTIGLLNLGPINFGNAGILTGVNRAARAADQTLLTTQYEIDPSVPGARERVFRDIDNLLAMRVDGLVMATPYTGIEALVDHIGDAVPVVSLSESASPRVRSVHADSYDAGLLAVRHLVELGHRRILHVSGPHDRNQASSRLQGYLDGLAEAGLVALPVIEAAEWDARSGAESADHADPATFTAVFAANDVIALGFLSRMRRRGLEAPRDFSIVGVDDMPEAQFFSPALTSARLDFEMLGETALRMVLDLVRGIEPHESGVIPTTLSVRESTRALPPDE
jgi:DNA-binding LacI/PurR family transcriptional regulator